MKPRRRLPRRADVVVDVGCHPHRTEESVYTLARRFRPALLLGFDPYPRLREGVEVFDETGTVIVRRRAAAWTSSGEVSYQVAGIVSGVSASQVGTRVPSIDLVALLEALPKRTVLKLDCEGAEYPLLQAVKERGADLRLAGVLVEWHPPETAHGWYRDRPELACPVGEWA